LRHRPPPFHTPTIACQDIATNAMTTLPKRQSPSEDEALPARKRQRIAPLSSDAPATGLYTSVYSAPHDDRMPSVDEQARNELRRSIVLALELVGFHSASHEALESFTLVTETCAFPTSPCSRVGRSPDRGSPQMSSHSPKTYRDPPARLDVLGRLLMTTTSRWRVST